MTTKPLHVHGMAPHTLFFAIRPPHDVAERIFDLASDYVPGGRWMLRDRLHITVLTLILQDQIPDGLVQEAADIAVSACVARFPVKFERIVASEKSAFLLPGEPLDALRMFRERLGLRLMRGGVDFRMGGRFSPHVTLAYNPDRHFEEELPDPVIWTVKDFVLIDSHVGATRHVEVGRWHLQR